MTRDDDFDAALREASDRTGHDARVYDEAEFFEIWRRLNADQRREWRVVARNTATSAQNEARCECR